MSGLNLFLGVIFSAIGLGMFIYGKKTQNYLFLLVGIIEMAYTYFSPNPLITLIVGIVLTVIPFIIK